MRLRNFSGNPINHLNRPVQTDWKRADRMSENRLPRRFAGILCTLIFLSVVCVDATDAKGQEVASLNIQSSQPVRDWFKEYDHIRSAAEMSFPEKLQTRMYLQKSLRPGVKMPKRISDLMSKMNSKYITATNAMERLPIVPETKELQEGYTEYFRRMGKWFATGANHDSIDIGETISLAASKKEIESLDRQNKSLDASLRKRYKIPRHGANK